MASMPSTFVPGAAENPSTKVEMCIACRNLRDKDYFSKSDPMVVLFVQEIDGSSYLEIGRTEVIQDTLNPDFVKKFVIDYRFEEHQKLKFCVYDVDSTSIRLDDHDFLGSMECSVGEIVANQGIQFRRNLSGIKQVGGFIIIVAEEVKECKEIATFEFRAQKLDKKDWFGKSDPFLVISRLNDDNTYSVVHKTEVVRSNLNPVWKPFTLPVRQLCKGEYERSIKIECYDWDSDGTSHDYIGEFTTNLSILSVGPGPENQHPCINMKKKAKKKSYKNSGVIILMKFLIEEANTFLDYIKGGTQLHFTVAVDFTASNGDPRDPKSLHFKNPTKPNSYATAIQAIGEIVQDYDHDKLFPALGFGARLPPDGRISHEFFLNGHPTNPYCHGVEGILEAYHRTLYSVQLYGPTNFSPVINHVARFARSTQDGSHYFILLIITDGIITDMPQTKQAIVQASSLPLSIIIVGVGSADFTAMEILDADNQRLSYNGVLADRDIVQFVPFEQFQKPSNWLRTKALLAKEVMAEVPDQVVGFMKSRGIKPRPQSMQQMPEFTPALTSSENRASAPLPPSYTEAPKPSWAPVQ